MFNKKTKLMKKNLLLSLIALFCITFSNAQNNEKHNYYLPSETNIFNQADLVFEGNFIRCVATYGTGFFDSTYGISEYRVAKVYKGDMSLAGGTILMVSKGEMLGAENFPWDGDFDDLQIVIPEQKEKGIPSISINTFSSKIFFSVNSDYPDDENSKYFQEKKYAKLDEVYVSGDYVASFKDLPFSDVVEMHNWMKQFNGYNFSDIKMERKPKQGWINGAEQDAIILDSEYYENLKQRMDSINKGTTIEIEQDSKKKEQEILVDKTLTLYINNPVKVQEGSKYYLKFDVMVKSNAPETFLAETAFSIKYNTSIFGSLPLNKINYTFGELFTIEGNNYVAILFEGTDNLSFNFFSSKPNAIKAQTHSAPVPLLHIKIELLGNVTIPADPVFFSVSELSNVSKYTDSKDASTSQYYFKTYYKTNNPPVITSFSPTSRVAGVGEILTINGSNFGTTPGKVYFRAADNGGSTYLEGLDNQYLNSSNWSNTQIKVIVPSYVLDGYGEIAQENRKNKGAGTGDIMVMTAQENFVSSSQDLTIPYSITNRENNGNIQRVYLAKQTCAADFLFVLDDNLKGNTYLTSMVTAMEAAMNKWSALTGMTLKFDKNSSGQPRFTSDLTIFESDRYEIGHSSTPVAMAVSTNKKQAIIGGNNFLYGDISPISINTNPAFSWNYSVTGSVGTGYASFYQAFLHELGHILLLSHVIKPSELMHYEILTGPTTIINFTSSDQAYIGAMNNKAASNNMITIPNNHNIYPVGGGSGLPLSVNFTITDSKPQLYQANVSGGVPPYSYFWYRVAITGVIEIESRPIEVGNNQRGAIIKCEDLPQNYVNGSTMPTSYNTGSCILKLIVTDKNGCTITGSPSAKSGNFFDDEAVNTDQEIALYPNPTIGSFTISNIKDATLYLYSAISGHLKTFEHVSHNEILHIGEFPNGIYFLKIIEDNRIKNEKIILNK